MKGRILEYSVQSNTGTISGTDGNRYQFNGAEWRGASAPSRGTSVNSEADGNQAKGVYLALSSSGGPGSKDKTAAGLLAIFLGGWGIHKFYLGYTGPGLVFLLTNTIGFSISWILLFTPNLILGVIAIIEGIIYLTKSDEEFQQTYVIQKKKWF